MDEPVDDPIIDDELVPEPGAFEDPDYYLVLVQIHEMRTVTAMVGANDEDTILIEAVGSQLYRAFKEGGLIKCDDIEMMAITWEDFVRYTKAQDMPNDIEQEVDEWLEDLHEEILSLRNEMQNPMRN